MRKRQENLALRRQEPQVDALIVGGGICGIAAFRDLALRTVKVLRVDRADFRGGTSAASSHMVHGGLRYLENGEYLLVREAVRQRNLRLKSAPHLVRPLPITNPIFKRFSGLLNAPLKFLGLRAKPRERGAAEIRLGLSLYDRYTRECCPGLVPPHRFASRQASPERFPHLHPRIICTATYYDASTVLPARVAVELICDAETDWTGTWAINYLRVEGASGQQGTLRDELAGDHYPVHPRIVINAAGPWIDTVNKGLGQPTHFIGGTKSSHLMLDHPQLRRELADHEFLFENDDGRIVLIFPLADKVLIGSTDIRFEDPERAVCTAAEEQYFLNLAKKPFPTIQIGPQQIVFRFSGVRPLPVAQAATTGQISRDHSNQTLQAGRGLDRPIPCMVGGKWTPFRAFGETMADFVLASLGRQRQGHLETLPIGGGRDYPPTAAAKQGWLEELHADTGLPPVRLAALVER